MPTFVRNNPILGYKPDSGEKLVQPSTIQNLINTMTVQKSESVPDPTLINNTIRNILLARSAPWNNSRNAVINSLKFGLDSAGLASPTGLPQMYRKAAFDRFYPAIEGRREYPMLRTIYQKNYVPPVDQMRQMPVNQGLGYLGNLVRDKE